MNVWWKVGIALALMVLSFSAGWIVNGWRLSSAHQTEKAEAVQANADHFRDATKSINNSANEYLNNSGQMKTQIAVIKKELNDVQKTNPIPADCHPDADRLRIIKDAVTAANSAAVQ